MDDLRPLEWLQTISILDTANPSAKPSTTPPKKKKPTLPSLLHTFPSLLPHLRSPTRRPPFSYATLILLALHHAPGRQCSLAQIYAWIRATFPFYAAESTSPAWTNSIRHNLSLNKCFVRVARGGARPGKGGFWRLDEGCEKKLMEGDNFYRLRKKRGKKKHRLEEPPRLEPIELEQVLTCEEQQPEQEEPAIQAQPEEPVSQTQVEQEPTSETPPCALHEVICESASVGCATVEQQAIAPELNELNIVLEEYYCDPGGCFEELELDIEHLIRIGGF